MFRIAAVLKSAACFAVIASPLAALDDVSFRLPGQGEEHDTLKALLKSASLIEQLDQEGRDDPQEVIAAARADYARMVEVLYAKGYYSPVVRIRVDGVEAAAIEPFSAPARISKVVVSVDPGSAFRFGRARVAPLAEDTAIPEGFASGAPALALVVRDAAQAAITGWREAGYAKASVADQDIIVRHAESELDVTLAMAPGRAVRFGDVIVRGESAVRPARVRQIAGIPRGAQFDPDDVEKAGNRLRGTGTFRSVQVSEADTVEADGSMDIVIDVVDRAPRRIGGGIELSTFDGLTLSGFWLHRNLLGGAERFRVEGEVSQLGGQGAGIDYTLSGRFEKPAVYGADTLFYAQAGLSHFDEPDYIETKAELEFGVNQEFSDTLTGELGLSLSYSEVTDIYAGRGADGAYPVRELTLFSMPAALTWDKRDNTLNPTSGFYIRAEADPFYEFDDGLTGMRTAVDARAYRGFGAEDRVVMAGRLQFGSLVGVEADKAPPGFLFYSGGGGTVRGQPYQSLDVDYGTDKLGGRSFVGLSGEMRIGVTDKASVVLFGDAGYVGPESFYDGSGDWHSGAGLGVRYDTPVGPIRFDLAGPVSGRTGDGAQIYIGIGQAF
ncbi:autotransporter assembly complex family protein [Cognatishimia sp. F0-27]|uniref:autotransporter assembly complex protein TamA n=1 Tax=Cognatishimia sp. F0-27 TaxID=2816855 RepID=UPI001D0C9FB0|nr:autotransporter assembly complex family protein [Cognatishimia sp. F0-27]MCC1492874.1 outer membrane protein assembly factor [Cognatishimia sp. F0-27]